MGWETSYWVIAAGILGYALFFFTNPVNRFFRDGLRCLHRYPRLWIWLSILGMSYALFQVLLEWEMGNLALSLNNLIYWPDFEPISWSVAAGRAWLSALELLAGLFNQAVVTYPLSAVVVRGLPGDPPLCSCRVLQTDLFHFYFLVESILGRDLAATSWSDHRLAIISV
jgi:hypothetical protein